jgi:hypothetical protein
MQQCRNCALWQLRQLYDDEEAALRPKRANRIGWCSLEPVPEVMG